MIPRVFNAWTTEKLELIWSQNCMWQMWTMELIKYKYSERKEMILNNEAKVQLTRRKIYHRLSMSL